MKTAPPYIVEIICEGESDLAQVMLDDFSKTHTCKQAILFIDMDPGELVFSHSSTFEKIVRIIRPVSSIEDRCIVYLLYFLINKNSNPQGLYTYCEKWECVDVDKLAPKKLLSFMERFTEQNFTWCFPAERAYQKFSELDVRELLVDRGDVGHKFRASYSAMLDAIETMQNLIWCPARLGRKDNYKRTGEAIIKFLRPIHEASKSQMKGLGFRTLKGMTDFFFENVSIGNSKKINYSAHVWPYAMLIMSCWFFRASLVYKQRLLLSEAVMSVTRAVEFSMLSQGMRSGFISLTPVEGRVVVNNKELLGVGSIVHEFLNCEKVSLSMNSKEVREMWSLLSIRNNSKLAHGVLDIEKELFDYSYKAGVDFSRAILDEELELLSNKLLKELAQSSLYIMAKDSISKEILEFFTSEI